MATEFFTEVVDGSSDVHGQVGLAVDAGNAPLIAYTTTSGNVMLAERTGTEWRVQALPCQPAARDEYRLSVAVDAPLPDRPPRLHIAYQSAATDHLIYGVRNAAWEFEEVPTAGGVFAERVRFSAMTLCPGVFQNPPFKNIPHVCYQADGALFHAAKAPPSTSPDAPARWKKNVEKVDASGFSEKGWFSTLAFDAEETLCIAYFDDLSPAGRTARRLRMARMTPGTDFPGQDNSWKVDVLDGGEILGEAPSLAHSITGENIISYYDRNTRALKICVSGDFPESPAVEVITGDVVGDTIRSSSGVSDQSRICVAYGSGGQLRFATRTGIGTFAIEDVEAGGEWPYLVFDSVGTAHVAHVAGGTLRYGLAPRSDDEDPRRVRG
jgi:hypothetical protein